MILEITNLDHNLIEADIRRLLHPFGEVGSVHLFRNGYHHRSSGKAHVEMPVDKEARQAYESLKGKVFFGKPLRITLTSSISGETSFGSTI